MESFVEIKNLSKSFGPTLALNNVSISFGLGAIYGLIGENGSGKSTVTSIYAGMQKADCGEMFYNGEKWQPTSMIDALQKGVGMIVQETGTIPGITVAENIFLGELDEFQKGILVDKKKLYEEAQKVLNSIGASHISASMRIELLDFQDRKIVEIAKVMSKNPTVLIVDETTTALSQKGRTIIYDIMEKMKKDNKLVIFISHDLDEIMEKCDFLTVLRDGNIIRLFNKEEFNPDDIKTAMIGRQLTGNYYRVDYDKENLSSEVVMNVNNISVRDLKNISLALHKGEILGIGGLSHCGMHTLGKVLFGNILPDFGNVVVNNKEIKNERVAMKNGIGYVAKDRDTESLQLDASIKDNIAIGGLDVFDIKGFLLPNREKKYVQKQIEALQIKCQDMEQSISSLSGGNKQKVVFGKWIGRNSDILILDCPTRGVDVGVKQAMYQLMYQMKQEGKSIVLISEELPELIGMSDRLLIMKDGEIRKEFLRSPTLSDADVIDFMI